MTRETLSGLGYLLHLLTVVAIIFCPIAADSQQLTPPKIQWEKCLGGSGNDEAYSVQQTADSGFLVIGISASGNGDVTGHERTIKLNTFKAPDGNDTTTYDTIYPDEEWIVKLSTSGKIDWEQCLSKLYGLHRFISLTRVG